MNRRQKIIVSVTGIFIVLLILVGLTYAYFLTQIRGNENDKSISVTTANLILEYGDGNAEISMSNIMPGTTIGTKTFTVTNKGNTIVEDYAVVLENVTNTFELREDIIYTLTCESVNKNTGAVSGTCSGVTSAVFPRGETIIITNDINANIIHKYELTVNYIETFTDQSVDMNKILSAKVNLYDRRSKIPYLTDETEVKQYLAKIDELESLAVAYLGDSATSTESSTYLIDKTKWLVFSTISKLSYDTSNWTTVAGAKDSNFLTYLTENNFDINEFKTLKYLATDNNEYSGVVHFSAPLAAQLYNTDAIYNLLIDEIDYNNLAGWAGDLQTLITNNLLPNISDQSDYNEIYTEMSSLIGKSGTYFDSDDLYADVDAINVYKLLSSSKTIKTSMQDYFTTKYKDRFDLFIKNAAGSYDYDALKTEIYKYTQYSYSGVTWPLYENTTQFSSTVATATRDSFTDYIWYLANLKVLNIFSGTTEFKKGTNVNFKAEYINQDDVKDSTLTNSDYTWSVINVDGSACLSTINNGVLSINANETSSQLLIKVSLNKSNKVSSTRIIDIE